MSLKTKWFEMTKNGGKTEDYREITPYWCKRLMLHFGKEEPTVFLENIFNDVGKC